MPVSDARTRPRRVGFMNILAFDTCFDACSVAVWRQDGDTIRTERELMRRGHAEALLPMIERTMTAAGLTFDRLDRIAVTHGPGTFTGARVAMSAALGFAFAHDLPVVTYSSLQCVARAAIEHLAEEARAYAGVMVVRDAKRERVFLEVADVSGQEILSPALMTVAEARELAAGQHWFALGSGVPLLIEGNAPQTTNLAMAWPAAPPDGIDEPDARFLLQDAARRTPVDAPVPLYLRPPDATPSSRPPLARLTNQSRADV